MEFTELTDCKKLLAALPSPLAWSARNVNNNNFLLAENEEFWQQPSFKDQICFGMYGIIFQQPWSYFLVEMIASRRHMSGSG
jgi:hypothetical protein